MAHPNGRHKRCSKVRTLVRRVTISRKTGGRQQSHHYCCRSLNKKVTEHSSASEHACSVKAEEQHKGVLDTFTSGTGDVHIDVADDSEDQHQYEGQTSAAVPIDDPGIIKTRSGKHVLHPFVKHAYDGFCRMKVVPVATVPGSALATCFNSSQVSLQLAKFASNHWSVL